MIVLEKMQSSKMNLRRRETLTKEDTTKFKIFPWTSQLGKTLESDLETNSRIFLMQLIKLEKTS